MHTWITTSSTGAAELLRVENICFVISRYTCISPSCCDAERVCFFIVLPGHSCVFCDCCTWHRLYLLEWNSHKGIHVTSVIDLLLVKKS